MKILLDESLPKRLKQDFKGHQVKTVPEAGWQGKKNGELLKLMTQNFDVFITADQNLQYQINIRNAAIPVVVLKAKTNRYDDLKRLVPMVMTKLKLPNLSGIIHIS